MTIMQIYLVVWLSIIFISISMPVQFQAIHQLSKRVDNLHLEFNRRMDDQRSEFNIRTDATQAAINDIRSQILKDHTERLVRLEEKVFHTHS